MRRIDRLGLLVPLPSSQESLELRLGTARRRVDRSMRRGPPARDGPRDIRRSLARPEELCEIPRVVAARSGALCGKLLRRSPRRIGRERILRRGGRHLGEERAGLGLPEVRIGRCRPESTWRSKLLILGVLVRARPPPEALLEEVALLDGGQSGKRRFLLPRRQGLGVQEICDPSTVSSLVAPLHCSEYVPINDSLGRVFFLIPKSSSSSSSSSVSSSTRLREMAVRAWILGLCESEAEGTESQGVGEFEWEGVFAP